ncbi:hypothetical protein DPMN_052973 [Dreissena polymorpha]|uniref:Uncharacterized protein n=1 Tax=Dreissena polymorpha TaxID=45954 RepID=A0A9D4HRQ9_DREPO|nr:hypothetical protein DPMN_052973 [Dreissena polymorpha]
MARMLIKADRNGCCLMHLQAVTECLSVFAAAGHFSYLRFAYYYLQQMGNLEKSNKMFIERSLMVFTLIVGAICAGLG